MNPKTANFQRMTKKMNRVCNIDSYILKSIDSCCLVLCMKKMPCLQLLRCRNVYKNEWNLINADSGTWNRRMDLIWL